MRVETVGTARRVGTLDWVVRLEDEGGFERVTTRERGFAFAFSSLKTVVRVVLVGRRV